MKGMAVLRLVCIGQVGHTSTRWCCQPVDKNGNYVRLWDDIICLLNPFVSGRTSVYSHGW